MSDIQESRAVKLFKEKTQNAMVDIQDHTAFRASDEHIEYIYVIADWLFKSDLYTLAESRLIRTGGRLTGVYAYLGNKAAYARAERDVYEQKKEEVMNTLTLKFYKETDKITHAKAQARVECVELEELVIQKEAVKNNYENVMHACQTMIMFIQSALKVKDNERYRGKMEDQH